MPHNSILVANHHRSVRESIGLTIQELRPGIDVQIVDPSDLPQAIHKHSPILVICSQLTASLKAARFTWILLPTDGENLAVVSILGRGIHIEDTGLPQIICIVDQAVRIGKMT